MLEGRRLRAGADGSVEGRDHEDGQEGEGHREGRGLVVGEDRRGVPSTLTQTDLDSTTSTIAETSPA